MTGRDEDGRPVATPNAGAFLGPTAMIPAPSTVLGADTAQVARQHQAPIVLAGLTALALWTLLNGILRYLLAATESAAAVDASVVGDEMTRPLHTDVAWIALNGVFLLVAAVLGRQWAHRDRMGDLVAIAAMAAAGALGLGLVIDVVGGGVLPVAAALSTAWLAVAYLVQRRTT